jgi:DNA-binding NarL/FixJ family response regulator
MGTTFTIAHVEDHPMLRKLLGIHLHREGFVPSCEAGNGVEFLEQLDNSGSVPDVCLLDLNMPVMDGFETARQLKERYPSIRILAYSGNDQPDRVEMALNCGAHGFVSKDLAPEEFNKGLRAVLSNQPFIMQHPVTVKGCGGKVAKYPAVGAHRLQ